MFTNGVARYLRRTKFAEYNDFAESSAEISWSAVDRPDEAEQIAARAATLARLQVERQLGLHKLDDYISPANVASITGKPAAEPVAPAPDATPTEHNMAAMRQLGKTEAVGAMMEQELDHYLTSVTPTPLQNDKATLAASMTNGGSGEIVTSKGGVPVSQLRAAFGTGRKPKSATQVVEAADMVAVNPPVTAPTQPLASPAPTPEPSIVGQNLMSSEPMPVEIFEGLPEPKTYTVAELGRACADAILRLKAAGDQAPSVTVQTLVGKFGKATNAIPEDKRGEFLAALSVLEPRK